eukprot:COSAG04_NODE_11515_length_705_cov_0.683168_1_plen_235_part_11
MNSWFAGGFLAADRQVKEAGSSADFVAMGSIAELTATPQTTVQPQPQGQAAHEEQTRLSETLAAIVQNLTDQDPNRWFSESVDASVLPDYHQFIKQPMDLGAMARKVSAADYTSVGGLQSDFDLMISNCEAYRHVAVHNAVFVGAVQKLNTFGSLLFEAVLEKPGEGDMMTKLQAFVDPYVRMMQRQLGHQQQNGPPQQHQLEHPHQHQHQHPQQQPPLHQHQHQHQHQHTQQQQ